MGNCDDSMHIHGDSASPCNNKTPSEHVDYLQYVKKTERCDVDCENLKGPKNVPVFSTTYVGRAKRHVPPSYMDYYDCSRQNGGKCNKAIYQQSCLLGRREANVDKSYFQLTEEEQKKRDEEAKNALKKKLGKNNMSKKQAYSHQVRTTRGLETFANKKVPSLVTLTKKKSNRIQESLCGCGSIPKEIFSYPPEGTYPSGFTI